jgi:hypothetical protein
MYSTKYDFPKLCIDGYLLLSEDVLLLKTFAIVGLRKQISTQEAV